MKIDRLLVISNRLPISLIRGNNKKWQVQPSTGGLVNALTPILRNMNGLWIGWHGTLAKVNLDEIIAIGSQNTGLALKPVILTREEINQYYLGFSNEIIWPLFHDLQSRCNFDPAYWNAYQAVNRKFTQVIAENARDNDYIWVHDYHFMLVAKELRSTGVKRRLGFFLHTPFPSLDIFSKLPWRSQILQALLEYDLIGFQTAGDRNNFIHCVEALTEGVHHDARRQVSTITMPNREIKAGIFPISIDFHGFAQQAADRKVAEKSRQLQEAIPCCQLILGIDRLDYSKGIPEKMKAFRNALERFGDLRAKVTLMQIVVPSREDIDQYQQLKSEIESLVSEINGEFTQPGWIPIHYMFRSLDRTELLAYYRAADIALVTPLKDGMNLVAKEYCAANVENRGILILSEFAGSATQLHKHALLVNPYDIEGVANTIHQACNMSINERRSRMQKLRESIRKHDVFRWADSFLRTGMAD